MRIFLSMGLVEHTGHGIPTIVERYGREAFEIENNYIRCVIPFDEDVMTHINKNVGMNVGMNVVLKPSEKEVLNAIIENPDDSAVKMAEKTGISIRTAERALSKLQQYGMVERIGSRRDGRWIVIK